MPSYNQILMMQQVAVHLEIIARGECTFTCFQPSLLQSAILGVPYNNYVLVSDTGSITTTVER